MDNNIKVRAYVLDTLQIDCPAHRVFTHFSKCGFEQFPKLLGTRVSSQGEGIIEILTTEQLSPFDPDVFSSEQERIAASFDILKCLWFLHSQSYFLGGQPLEGCLVTNRQQAVVKCKPYLAVPVEGYQWGQVRKDKAVAANGIELCFSGQKLHEKLDLWKWGVLVGQWFFRFSIEKYIDCALSSQKLDEVVAELSTKTNFLGSEELLKVTEKCLRVNPKQRPEIQEIVLVYQKLLANSFFQVDRETLKLSAERYSLEEQLPSDIKALQSLTLSEDIKKKLKPVFVKNGHKPPAVYKLLYRATKSQFSIRGFYEQCSQIPKLLFVIECEEAGLICAYLQPAIKPCQEGLAGAFIADHEQKSFIYSGKHQDSFKLSVKDKAFKSVPGYGPIIGDGDIMLGSDRSSNLCNFPRSYNGKGKKLMAKALFSIKNYDVYSVGF